MTDDGQTADFDWRLRRIFKSTIMATGTETSMDGMIQWMMHWMGVSHQHQKPIDRGGDGTLGCTFRGRRPKSR